MKCRTCAFKKQNNITGEFLGCNRNPLDMDDISCILKRIHFIDKEAKDYQEIRPQPQEKKTEPEVNTAKAENTKYLNI